MKIYDIIKEDEKQVDEVVGLLRAAGNVIKPAFNAIRNIGKAKPTSVPKTIGQKVQNAKANVATGYGNAMELSDEALKWYTRYKGIWEPISEYRDNMAVWEKKLKNGEITEKEYEYAREKYLSYMIGRIGTYVAVSGMIRTTVLPAVSGLRFFDSTKAAGSTLSVLARGANLYVVTEYLNSPEGKEMIAKAFAEGPLGDSVAPLIGGSAAKLIDRLKGKIREKSPEDEEEEKAARAPVNTLAGPEPGYDPKNPPDTPSNLTRDPVTGKLRIKTDY